MGQLREVDAISDAIVATEREIAGEAWDIEDTDPADETGDRSLESMGEGLEGQHEADEDETETEDSEETEDEEESEEGEDEGEDGEGSEEPKGAKEGEVDKPADQQQTQKPEGRVPSGKLRQALEARRAVEAERDQLKSEIEALKKAPGDNRAELDALKAQVGTLTQLLQGVNRGPQPQAKTEPAEPEVPDIFENPKGFMDHIAGMVQKAVAPLAQQRVADRIENSMALAHATHKGAFEDAFAAMQSLNPQNPDDRATVQRISASPNPGEELVRWHKRTRTLAEVGDDPAAFRDRVKADLMKDPEFRKSLLAEIRKEAGTGENGAPRTETRLPKSLNRQSGSNLGSERMDHRASDNSEQAVADAAWR